LIAEKLAAWNETCAKNAELAGEQWEPPVCEEPEPTLWDRIKLWLSL